MVASAPIDGTDESELDVAVSRLTGELLDPALEGAFRHDLAEANHRIWFQTALCIAVAFVAFSLLDLGSLGVGSAWLFLLGGRLVAAAVVAVVGVRIGRDPAFPNAPTGRAAIIGAQLLMAAAALCAMAARPADALTNALSLTVFLLACAVVVPGRFRDQLTLCAVVAAGLVLVSVSRFDDPPLPTGPLVANLTGALLLGATIRMLMNRDQRRRWIAGRRLADQLAEAGVLRGELERLVREDPLTGAVNRREFLAELSRRLADRRGSAALVVLDLDRFKSVNDRYGHPTGDAVLVAVVEALRRATRQGDVVARLGGEEFAVALSDAAPEAVSDAAGRMRAALAALPPLGLDHPVTASFGVAVQRRGESVEALMARADAAMYGAKRGGGDAVVVADRASNAPPGLPA